MKDGKMDGRGLERGKVKVYLKGFLFNSWFHFDEEFYTTEV